MQIRHATWAFLLGALTPPSVLAQLVPDHFFCERIVGEPFSGAPTGFTFLPDGRPVIIERNGGRVRLAAVGASTSVPIHTIPNIAADNERGLLGVAVDPEWPVRPYVYFYYTRTDSTGVVDMRTASGALENPASTSVTLGSPYSILEFPDESAFHNGGTLRFGPDGMLYLSVGDDATRCNAQTLETIPGSILRLDVSAMPGQGKGPPPKSDITPADNPFVGDADENARLVWALGLRNPFRFDVDSLSGDVFIGDVGHLDWEEINVVPWTSGGGANFGWPLLEGPEPPGFGDTCGQGSLLEAPIFQYPHVSGGYAVIGGPLYRAMEASPISLPAWYEGSYFFGDWGGQWIRRLTPTANGWELAAPVPGQPSAENWAQSVGQIVDLQAGPEGGLWYIVQTVTRGLWRISSTSTTSAPHDWQTAGSTGGITAFPNPGRSGATIRFVTAGEFPPAPALFELFDIRGRRAAARVLPPGAARLEWNGHGNDGAPVPAGVYFVRVSAPGVSSISGRVEVLR